MSRAVQGVASVVVAAMTLGACVSVAPWERGVLARPEMQLDPNTLQTSLYEQVYYSKEASRTGTKPAGAGCGCN